jgi:hypothetical protein
MNLNLLTRSALAILMAAAPLVAYAQTAQEQLAASTQVARAETENTRAELQKAMATLTALQAQTSGDLRPNFDKFAASLDSTRAAANLTGKRVDTMKADSGSYFASWKSELATIKNKDIRQPSEKRLQAVQKEYAAVLAKMGQARTAFAPMLSDAEDLRTALGTDLTPSGLKSQNKSVSKTNKGLAAAQKPVMEALLAFDKLAKQLTPTGAK